ncbi:MAG TPA: hypothetical protein VII56_19595 [Rhizomicrobium sp.]
MPLLELPSQAPEPRPWQRNGAAAALVALLHGLLIGFIAISLPTRSLLLPAQREIFLFFHPAQKPTQPQSRMIAIPPARSISPPLFRYTPPPRASNALSPPMVTGLGLSLFGCAPENLANLTRDQRAHCSGALSIASLQGAIPGAVTIHAVQSARWSAAIAARNAPLAVPCTSLTKTVGRSLGSAANTVMVDPLCVLHELTTRPDK